MLGSRIASLRKERQWSQAVLADRIGVSPSAVGMYEQGRREPSGDILIALATAFGVSVDYLLTGQEPHTGLVRMPALAAMSREDLIVLMAAQLMGEL